MKYGIKWHFWNFIEVWSRKVYYYASERCNKLGDSILNKQPIIGTDSNTIGYGPWNDDEPDLYTFRDGERIN